MKKWEVMSESERVIEQLRQRVEAAHANTLESTKMLEIARAVEHEVNGAYYDAMRVLEREQKKAQNG